MSPERCWWRLGINSVAIQSDGKIVAAGYISGHLFALARYNADGSLDTSFGSGGIVTTLFSAFAGANSVAIQSDGKIVVAGGASNGGASKFALARYNQNGSLDASFGKGGKVTTPTENAGRKRRRGPVENDSTRPDANGFPVLLPRRG